MAPHSSTLSWKIQWMEEPGRLESMGSLRVRHNWATSLSLIGEGNGNPLQCSCLENPRDGGAWWAAIYEAAQSRTRLKWLNSNRAHFINIFFHSLFLLPYLKNFASFSVIFFSLCFSEKCNGLSYWFHRILKSKVLHSQRYHFTSTRWLKWKKWRIMHDSVVYC